MTKLWGPLGWATLHSVSASYPDNPSDSEQELVKIWMKYFCDTIVCPSCLEHFASMLNKYTNKWWSSRREFVQFVLRAHNSVNQRTNKKIYTPLESISELKRVVPESQATDKRKVYLVYIRGDWVRNMTLQGVTNVPKLKELFKIEDEYWSKRSFSWDELLNFKDIQWEPIVERHTPAGEPIIPKIVPPASFSIFKSRKVSALQFPR